MLELLSESNKILERLSSGIFLISKHEDITNVMSIGWASTGISWYKPVFVIMVREAHYTRQIIDKSKEFVLTAPVDDSMDATIMSVGRISGKSVNKIKEFDIKMLAGEKIETPRVDCKGITLECRVLYSQLMDQPLLESECQQYYENGIKHVFYYGEILNLKKHV